MNNLATIANQIGQRCGRIQDRDQAACKNFLKKWHDHIWRSKLWKDSLVEYVISINTANAYTPNSPFMPTKGHLILPSIIEDVVAVRSSAGSMDVIRPMLYYRTDFDKFIQTGVPLEYWLLSACAWEFDTPYGISIQTGTMSDVNQPVNIEYGAVDGVSVTRLATTAQLFENTLITTDVINRIIAGNATGGLMGDLWVVVGPTSTPFTVANGNNGGGPLVGNGVYSLSGTLNGFNTYTSADGQFIMEVSGGAWHVFMIAGMVPQYSSTDANPTTFPWNSGGWSCTTGLGTPITATAPATSAPLITMPAGSTSIALNQRIRFSPILNTTLTIRVLGKRQPPSFSADSDVPGLQGMEPILSAVGYAEMLQRDERGGTAEYQAEMAMAVGANFLANGVTGGMLKQLEDKEVVQGASNTRIQPVDGFANDWSWESPTKFW